MPVLVLTTHTLQVMTQKWLWTVVHPIHKRYWLQQQQLSYNHLNTTMYSDMLIARKILLSSGNNYGKVFTNEVDFTKVVPTTAKEGAGEALSTFCQDIGILGHLHMDGTKEITQGM